MRAAVCLLVLSLAACSGRPHSTEGGGGGLSLQLQLARAVSASEGSLERDFPVTRNGRRESAAVLVAPVRVHAPLDGASGRLLLQARTTPVFNIGDGFQLQLVLVSPEGTREVHRRYYDPGRRAEDRRWSELEVPLDLPPGQECRLEIAVTAGPRGDLVGDWLALADLRLVAEGERQ